MRAPAGVAIEVQGFIESTRETLVFATASTVADPSGNPDVSSFTLTVNPDCARSTLPPRIVVDGAFAGTFNFTPGGTLDLGLLTPVTDPAANTSAPSAGGGLDAAPGAPSAGGAAPGSGRAPSALPNTGQGHDHDLEYVREAKYLYAALGLFVMAGAFAFGPWVRRRLGL